MEAEDSVELPAGSRNCDSQNLRPTELRVVARLRVSLKRVLACSLSESLYRRDLAFRCAELASFFFADHSSSSASPEVRSRTR